MRFLLLFAALLAAAPALAQTRLFASGLWTALDRGAVCDAATRGELVAPEGRVQAIAGFIFSADRRRWGEFYTRRGRPVRPGSSVILQVGNQPFLLVASGHWAWSRGRDQQEAIITAVRASPRMKVE